MAESGYWDPEKKAFVFMSPRAGGVVYSLGIDPAAGEYTATSRYVNGKLVSVTTREPPYKKLYEMSPAALEHFSKPDVQAWMRERVKEAGSVRFYWHPHDVTVAQAKDKYFNSAGIWLDGLDTNDKFWADMLRDGRVYADSVGQPLPPVTTAKQYQELFGKPAPVGMFEPMTESYAVAVDSLKKAWTEHFALSIPLQPAIPPMSPFPSKEELGVVAPYPVATVSNNCASCGDALHPKFDPPTMHEGQRVHSSCAARLERLKAEAAPKVAKADPYASNSEREEMIRLLMVERNSGFVSTFRADQPAPEYREKFAAHPWSSDDE